MEEPLGKFSEMAGSRSEILLKALVFFLSSSEIAFDALSFLSFLRKQQKEKKLITFSPLSMSGE